jgi:hypothetical protein
MPRILRCDCGHRLSLSDTELNELTWCPECRKVLVRPGLYRGGERNFTAPRPRDFPATVGQFRLLCVVVVGLLSLVAFVLGFLGKSLDATRRQELWQEPSRFPLQPGQPPFDDQRPRPFDFDRGFLPDPAAGPKVDDPQAPFRRGVDDFPGMRPGGPERRPDDP